MPARLPSRLRQSHFPVDDPPDPSHIPAWNIETDETSVTKQDASSKQTSEKESFILQILPSPVSEQNTLPALLGLDTLSLSLPSSFRQAESNTKSRTKQQAISKVSISNIPRNQIHLLFSSPKLDTGVRSGFWLSVQPKSTNVIAQWDADKEELILVPGTGEQDVSSSINTAGVKEFDYTHLLALKAGSRANSFYESNDVANRTQDQLEPDGEEWLGLISDLTPSQLDRILPVPLPLSFSGHEFIKIWQISTLSSTPTTNNDVNNLPSNIPSDESALHYTSISFTRTFPPDAIGSERTRWARDRSWYLSSLTIKPDQVDDSPNGSILLSEFRISFLQSMLLGNYPSLAQWKAILALGLTCRSALSSRDQSSFFVSFIHILAAQIRYHTLETTTDAKETQQSEQNVADSGSIFEIHGSDGEELARLLRSFGDAVADHNTDPAIQEAFRGLCKTTEDVGLNWGLDTRIGTKDVNGTSGVVNGTNGLSRRLLRLREGFGDDDFDAASGEDDEEENGEFAPVVVDLDGSLAFDEELDSDKEEEHESRHSSKNGSEEEDDDMDVEDLRY